MDYSEITNLQELRLARKQLAVEIQSREEEVVNDFHRLKLLLSPVYWLQRALRSWQTLSRTWSFLMRAYRTVRDFLAKQKASRMDKPQKEASRTSAQTEQKNEWTKETR